MLPPIIANLVALCSLALITFVLVVASASAIEALLFVFWWVAALWRILRRPRQPHYIFPKYFVIARALLNPLAWGSLVPLAILCSILFLPGAAIGTCQPGCDLFAGLGTLFALAATYLGCPPSVVGAVTTLASLPGKVFAALAVLQDFVLAWFFF